MSTGKEHSSNYGKKNGKAGGKSGNASKDHGGKTGTSGKAKTNAALKKPVPGIPEGWFYLAEREVTLAELRAAMPEGTDLEFWREAGVMEIVLGEAGSVDVEEMDVDTLDEEAAAFMEEQKAKKLFYLSFRPQNLEAAKPYLMKMKECGGGVILGDTPNLQPSI